MSPSAEPDSSIQRRPGIFVIGPPNVGKRTILSRLLSLDFDDAPLHSSSEILAHGWTIDTKYYKADISVWMGHLHDGFSITSLPVYDQLAALVMVFDISDRKSFVTLREWVSRTDICKFDILLCIGNKVDLVPGHLAHAEYRRRLQRYSDSADPFLELEVHGLSELEGCSLLENEEPSYVISKSCLEWCSENNIEYIESCASNIDFDKSLSVDGDSQGIERLYDALSAHMWPGMTLKSGNKILEPSYPNETVSTDEESDYEIEYEVLSSGSAEPWDDTDNISVSAPVIGTTIKECGQENLNKVTKMKREEYLDADEGNVVTDESTHFDFEDAELLMSEIRNMRDNVRLMPDFQRREMAANLALKMANLFGDAGSEEDGFDL